MILSILNLVGSGVFPSFNRDFKASFFADVNVFGEICVDVLKNTPVLCDCKEKGVMGSLNCPGVMAKGG